MEQADLYEAFHTLRDTLPAEYPPNVCRICEEPFDEDSTVVVEPCGHKFCRNCCEQHVKTKIMDQFTVHDVQCPEFGCRSRMEIHQLFSLIKDNQKLYEQMLQRSLEYCLQFEEEVRKCPTPDCPYAVLAPPSNGCPPIDCPVCQFSFCYDCSAASHPGTQCQRKSDRSEALMSAFKTAKVIKCPKCSAKIEKTLGCDAMTCSVCKAHLCWGCGKEFETDFLAHSHNCKKELYDLRIWTAREVGTPDDRPRHQYFYRPPPPPRPPWRASDDPESLRGDDTDIDPFYITWRSNSQKIGAEDEQTVYEDVDQESIREEQASARNGIKERKNLQDVEAGLGDSEGPSTDGSLHQTKCRMCLLCLFLEASIITVPLLTVLSIFILPVLFAKKMTKKMTKNKFYYLKTFGLWFSLVLLIPLAAPFSLVFGSYWSVNLWWFTLRDQLFNT